MPVTLGTFTCILGPSASLSKSYPLHEAWRVFGSGELSQVVYRFTAKPCTSVGHGAWVCCNRRWACCLGAVGAAAEELGFLAEAGMAFRSLGGDKLGMAWIYCAAWRLVLPIPEPYVILGLVRSLHYAMVPSHRPLMTPVSDRQWLHPCGACGNCSKS